MRYEFDTACTTSLEVEISEDKAYLINPHMCRPMPDNNCSKDNPLYSDLDPSENVPCKVTCEKMNELYDLLKE